MRFLLHKNGAEPPLKQMPHLAMAAIEDLRVDPVELPHPAGEIRLRRLNQQMIVIVHQTIGMAQPPEAADHLAEDRQPDLTIRWRAWPRLVTWYIAWGNSIRSGQAMPGQSAA